MGGNILLYGGDPRYTTHLVTSRPPVQEEDCSMVGNAGSTPEHEE